MKIIIKELSKSKNYVELSKLKWELFSKKNKKLFLLEFLVGLCLIVLGLLNKESIFKGLNLTVSFGIAFIFLSLIYYYHQFRNEQLYFRKVNWYLQKCNNIQTESIIEINDESVKYEDFENKQELKWSIFTSYKFMVISFF